MFQNKRFVRNTIGEVVDLVNGSGEPNPTGEDDIDAVATGKDLGKEFEEYLEYPKGDPREPMTMDDLENKFNSLAGEKFDDNAKAQLKSDILNCEDMSSGEFMNKLNI